MDLDGKLQNLTLISLKETFLWNPPRPQQQGSSPSAALVLCFFFVNSFSHENNCLHVWYFLGVQYYLGTFGFTETSGQCVNIALWNYKVKSVFRVLEPLTISQSSQLDAIEMLFPHKTSCQYFHPERLDMCTKCSKAKINLHSQSILLKKLDISQK